METVTIESIPILVGREEDGRWWADIESMPGVMAYGSTREAAIAAVKLWACVSSPIASTMAKKFLPRSTWFSQKREPLAGSKGLTTACRPAPHRSYRLDPIHDSMAFLRRERAHKR
jgi:hypothetical protein